MVNAQPATEFRPALLNDHVASPRQIQNSRLNIITAFEANTSTGCVTFTNQAPTALVRVVIAFTAIWYDGGNSDYGYATVTTTVAPGAQGDGCGPKVTPANDPVPRGTVASPIEVDYADGTTWNAGPDVLGVSDDSENGDIEIARTFAWQPLGECVDFVAHGTKTITHVQFNFEHVTTGGVHIANDALDTRGNYKPSEVHPMNCRRFAGTIIALGQAPGSPRPGIEINSGPSALIGSVSRIDYADGTSWHAPSKSEAATPPGAPKIVYDSWWIWTPGFMQIPFNADPASSIEIVEAFMWPFFENIECVQYITHSPIATKHVRFVFVRTGTDGTTMGTDVLDTSDRHGFSQGVSHDVCFTTQPNPIVNNKQGPAGIVISYPSEWAGGSVPMQYAYDGLPYTLSVIVDKVDFVNGTSWVAPRAEHAPKGAM